MSGLRTLLYNVYSEDNDMVPRVKDLAHPINVRSCSSLVNFRSKYLFLSGGYDPEPLRDNRCYSSVDVFDFSKNTWSPAPSMFWPRSSHSTCVVNQKSIYAFFGYDSE